MTNSPRAPRALYRRLTALLLVAALLPWVLPVASAAVSPGTTAALVNSGQVVRESSSAVPVVGFSLNATTNEALEAITLHFAGTGFTTGDDRDLSALETDSRVSGVGLYRDDGSTDDVLDATDTPVPLDAIQWNGNDVQIDLGGNNEPLPAAVSGSFAWFIVVRTSEVSGTLTEGDQIVVRVLADMIVATDGAGFTTQPATDLTANALTVRLTRTVDLVAGNPWVGNATVAVNERAVLGMRLVDGGILPNKGIADGLTALTLRLFETAGTVTSSDFQPLSTDATASGIGIYRDNGAVDDEWDPADAPVNLSSLTPLSFGRGGVTFDIAFSPAYPVPDAPQGALEFFFVVRTGDIVTGDAFTLRVEASTVLVDGTLSSASGGPDARLPCLFNTGSTRVTSSEVRGDSTPPSTRNERWSGSNSFVSSQGLTLYFNQNMTATQFPAAIGEARDDQSGVFRAVFTPEAGLAASPPNFALGGAGVWRFYSGAYGFNNTSADSTSPAEVTIFDAVGNSLPSSSTGRTYRYVFEPRALLIAPAPGWTGLSQPSAQWVDPAGMLWFSDLITGTANAQLTVNVVSLYGGGVRNVTASATPDLTFPSPSFNSYAPGAASVTWTTTYQVLANSTAAVGSVTVGATDHSGGSLSADFLYAEDTEAPRVNILAPTSLGQVSGNLLVRATATDGLTGVALVQVEVDPGTGFSNMFFDGSAYFFPISTTAFAEGAHRIIVRATDRVGNVGASSVDSTFRNSAVDTRPPTADIASPTAGSYVSGVVTFGVLASDDRGVASVTLRFDGGVPQAASFNASSGAWELALSTITLPDGAHTAVATARDLQGNEASSNPVSFTVDNAAPRVSVSFPVAFQTTAGLLALRVFASDAVGIAGVTIEVFATTVDMALNPSTGYFEYTIDTRSLQDGNYSARATATDLSGKAAQTGAVAFSVSNFVDLEAPRVELLAPAPGAFVSGTLDIRVQASDNVGLAELALRVDGGAPLPFAPATTGSGYSVAWDTASASEGVHTLEAFARDAAGHETATAERSVTVDNQSPRASIAFPSSGQRVSGVVTIRIAASDEVGLSTVSVTAFGRTVEVPLNPSTGYFEYALDTRGVDDGSYTVSASARDLSGKNVTGEAVSFQVQNGDLWRGAREVASFLLLPFLFFVFVLAVILARRGTLARWMRGEGAAAPPDETKAPRGGRHASEGASGEAKAGETEMKDR